MTPNCENQQIEKEGVVAMDISVTEAVKDELFKGSQVFRDLVQQHQNYENRLENPRRRRTNIRHYGNARRAFNIFVR